MLADPGGGLALDLDLDLWRAAAAHNAAKEASYAARNQQCPPVAPTAAAAPAPVPVAATAALLLTRLAAMWGQGLLLSALLLPPPFAG